MSSVVIPIDFPEGMSKQERMYHANRAIVIAIGAGGNGGNGGGQPNNSYGGVGGAGGTGGAGGYYYQNGGAGGQ